MAKKGLNRDVIVGAAAALVEQKGLDQITLHELADALGVKTASLYNHLQGMPELSARLTELALTRLMDALHAAMDGRRGMEAFRALGEAYRAFAREQPQLYRAMIRLPQFEDTGLLELKNSFMHLFREVLAPYGLPEETQIHYSRMLRSALHGFVSLEAAGFFRRAVDADESYAFLLAHLAALPGTETEARHGAE